MAQQASVKSQSEAQALTRLPYEHTVGMPLADALQLLSQPLYVNQELPSVLLYMDMLVQVAVFKQPVEL